ncbi:ATP-binding protein [Spirosoma pomorum]
MTLLETLRQFSFFAVVPDQQLQWLLDRAQEERYPVNHVITKPGEPVDYLTLILEGVIVIDSGHPGPDDDLITYGPYSIMGLLPFSRMKQSSNRVIVEQPAYVLRLHRDQFRDMTQTCYELTEALVQQMTTRVRDMTRQTQQEDKMASLGRLSAGLAHELNNPVSAVSRSAETLRDYRCVAPDVFKAMMRLNLDDAQVNAISELFRQKTSQTDRKPLSMMERSSREDELLDWLDDHGLSDDQASASTDVAGPLAEYDFTVDELDTLLEQVGEDNLSGGIRWLVDNLMTERLVNDIGQASERIATLVTSIKNYTHMDRSSGRDSFRLADGVQSTLTLLGHKLKSKHIQLTVDMPDDLPAVCGRQGELNQVWTNLIDNAIDAMDDGGMLTISSEVDRRADGEEFLQTKIIDNGSGIPDDIRDKLFEPFFTTKEIGKGTGLGLDIVRGIVKQHNGSIKFESEPGRTEFCVCLPTN